MVSLDQEELKNNGNMEKKNGNNSNNNNNKIMEKITLVIFYCRNIMKGNMKWIHYHGFYFCFFYFHCSPSTVGSSMNIIWAQSGCHKGVSGFLSIYIILAGLLQLVPQRFFLAGPSLLRPLHKDSWHSLADILDRMSGTT